MALDTTTANALANEARKQEARASVAGLRAEVNAYAVLGQILSSTNGDAQRRLTNALSELAALEAGAGPGLTDEFGGRSSVDQLLRTERFAGKSAAVDFVKANPECLKADAIAAWEEAAKAATGLPLVIQSPAALGALYRQQLLANGLIQADTWEEQRAWIVATDKAVIMGA